MRGAASGAQAGEGSSRDDAGGDTAQLRFDEEDAGEYKEAESDDGEEHRYANPDSAKPRGQGVTKGRVDCGGLLPGGFDRYGVEDGADHRVAFAYAICGGATILGNLQCAEGFSGSAGQDTGGRGVVPWGDGEDGFRPQRRGDEGTGDAGAGTVW